MPAYQPPELLVAVRNELLAGMSATASDCWSLGVRNKASDRWLGAARTWCIYSQRTCSLRLCCVRLLCVEGMPLLCAASDF
jgi:hypothetical protein